MLNQWMIYAIAALIGSGLTWFFLRSNYAAEKQVAKVLLTESAARLAEFGVKMQQAEDELRRQQLTIVELKQDNASLMTLLEAERRETEVKSETILKAKQEMTDTFKSLAQDALSGNNRMFLDLATAKLEKTQVEAKGELDQRRQAIQELVKPVKESLDKVDAKIQELEKARSGAYEGLMQQVKTLNDSQNLLRQQTTNLVQALRTPTVRGRWGEIQLKRVVEMAGMIQYCDFNEQVSVSSSDGMLRPDMIIKLPGNKNVIVDAKAPLTAYLEAMDEQDDKLRQLKLRDHARSVRSHITALAKKAYWDQFAQAPEFVILFLPGENFFSAALEQDPALIEFGVEQKIIVATPTTLIALLRSVAYGWRQETMAQNSLEISNRAKELYKRLIDFTQHMAKLGKSLDASVDTYNKAVGSLETRVMVTARRFTELDPTLTPSEQDALGGIERTARQLQSPEAVNYGCQENDK